ncbi:MAG: N-6 DNA methylase [Verrucomicrobia bacterium]|nr:N-6 DNA methylase [Verrucomicrobiota bacterium]
MAKLTQQELEAHLWGSANILRGKTAGQDYKTYILSLMFFKRLSDQWDCEAEETVDRLQEQSGMKLNDAQRKTLLASAHVHRFKIPDGCHWQDVLGVSENIGEMLNASTRGGPDPRDPTRKRQLIGIAPANRELAGVFTVDWNQPAPDGQGKLIPNVVVHALVQHFDSINLSNANVPQDILGRAYEYLIKMFADDAGAKAGEFFTPPAVVDILVRILEPKPGDTAYDPTCGTAGMLIHSGDYVKENGFRPDQIRYFGQEMNWQTYAIARINMILHGLESDIRGGKSTLLEPLHLKPDGSLEKFDVVMANFPFSDEVWWLPEDQRTDEQIKKSKKKLGKEGIVDKYNRFIFGTPPASNGDFAYIQHILASLTKNGRAGIVCPQGVLFRGQPEIEEETGEFNEDGTPKIRRRKADDEYLIRTGILNTHWLDAIIGLPLNIFYGAGVPACLLIFNKNRPKERQEKLLCIYAARHYRELSAQNELRPQDVMRILVHYHAYGDGTKAAKLVEAHSKRLRDTITTNEQDDIARITAEYQEQEAKLADIAADLRDLLKTPATSKTEQAKQEKAKARLEANKSKPLKKLAERDERIAESRKRAEEERQAIITVGKELVTMYGYPAELAKHARVVDMVEIEENESNLNIPRYVDTFQPEVPIDVNTALAELDAAEGARQQAERQLRKLLKTVAYTT